MCFRRAWHHKVYEALLPALAAIDGRDAIQCNELDQLKIDKV